MARISYVNGKYMTHAAARVHIEDRGYQFSDGIYEYIAFYNRVMLDGDLHLKRLERSLKELEIKPPVSLSGMKVIIRELIARNSREDGGLYIQITRGVAKRDHGFPRNIKPSLVMTICAAKLPTAQKVKDGVKVITTPDLRWARRDIKSISLLGNIISKQEAMGKGAHEAWQVEDGNIISEGSASNAYIITKKGELVTHHADQHILGGIVRDVLLKLARKAGIPVAERAFSVAEAKAAAEAFLTSTSANVLPVVAIDDTKLGNGKPGPITRKLQELYNAHVTKQTGKTL